MLISSAQGPARNYYRTTFVSLCSSRGVIVLYKYIVPIIAMGVNYHMIWGNFHVLNHVVSVMAGRVCRVAKRIFGVGMIAARIDGGSAIHTLILSAHSKCSGSKSDEPADDYRLT